jgi:arylsulfatase A-like enzyme
LDSLLGEVLEYLDVKRLWDEMYLVLAADHGYHLGCSTARKVGAKIKNWCADHPGPHDCEVWDFAQDRSTGVYSGCSRRVPFIVSGGALAAPLRGKALDRAEIIDVAPTIADILGVPYTCEGSSILRR